MTLKPDLRDLHEKLAARFLELRDRRKGAPVYALEHLLNEAELVRALEATAAAFAVDPALASPEWRSTYLPLLVLATEAGYRYRGTGTDFWPRLSRNLGIGISNAARIALSGLFRLGHERFSLRKPGASPWERRFPHIAWPIGNAVAPIEIHAPLAQTLRMAVRSGVAAEDPETLLERVGILSRGYASRRFETWLAEGPLALETMRRLMDPSAEGWLSPQVLERIEEDLRSDREAGRALQEARRVGFRSPARRLAPSPARFLLIMADDKLERLILRGPLLSAEERLRVAAALEAPGDHLRVAGCAAPWPLAGFLSGGETDLGIFRGFPEAPLRRSGPAERVSETAERLLEALQPKPPQIFRAEEGGAVAAGLLPGETIDPAGRHLRLTPAPSGEGFVLTPIDLPPSTESGRLSDLDHPLLAARACPAPWGLPLFDGAADFASSFPLLVPTAFEGQPLLLDGEPPPVEGILFGGVDYAALFPAPGPHRLAAEGAAEAYGRSFRIVEPPETPPAAATLLPERATIDDLLSGEWELRLSAPLPLEDLPLSLELRAADLETIRLEARIPRLPARIGGRAPLLERLREALNAQRPDLTQGAHLAVRFGEVFVFRFFLRPAPRLFVWDPASRGWRREMEESVEAASAARIASRIAAPPAPLPRPQAEEALPSETALLVLPDSAEAAALACGFLIGARGSFRPGEEEAAAAILPLLLREAASQKEGLGMEALAEAWLGWRLARAPDPLADWSRRRVADRLESAAVAQFCGPRWRGIEAQIDPEILDPVLAFRAAARRRGLLSGPDLPEIAQKADRDFLNDRIHKRLRDLTPEPQEGLEDWSEDLAADLDLAVIEAYEDLRALMIADDREPFEEPDMARPPEDWRAALEEARDLPALPAFRPLILPDLRWVSLSERFVDSLSEDDLVDLLDSTHLDAHRRSGFRWIGRAELRAMLDFWIAPGRLLEEPEWRSLLARGLSDAYTARAVRYLTLRRRLSSGGMSG